jgi:hypothetical protein
VLLLPEKKHLWFGFLSNTILQNRSFSFIITQNTLVFLGISDSGELQSSGTVAPGQRWRRRRTGKQKLSVSNFFTFLTFHFSPHTEYQLKNFKQQIQNHRSTLLDSSFFERKVYERKLKQRKEWWDYLL